VDLIGSFDEKTGDKNLMQVYLSDNMSATLNSEVGADPAYNI
jgi:hypothetical protein